MQRGKESVHNGVEIFVPNGRENFQAHTLEFKLARGSVMGPAIDGHLVPACYQPGSEMFSEGFETAVVGWNPSGPKNRDSHTLDRRKN